VKTISDLVRNNVFSEPEANLSPRVAIRYQNIQSEIANWSSMKEEKSEGAWISDLAEI
jgi:hypothetical protein